MKIGCITIIAILLPSLQEALADISTSNDFLTTRSMILEAVDRIAIPHNGISDSNNILSRSAKKNLAEKIYAHSISLTVNDLGRIVSTLTRNQNEDDSKANKPGDIQINHTKYPIQIAIAVIEEMIDGSNTDNGINNVDTEELARQFASNLHNKWGIGQEIISSVNDTSVKGRNGGTGVLVFLSVRDRVVFVSVGGALEHLLTHSRIDRIIHDDMKDLQRNDYEGGLTKGIDAIVGILEKGEEPLFFEKIRDMWFNTDTIVEFLWILFVVGNVASHRWQRKWDQRIYAKAASQLSEIDRARAELLQASFTPVKSCPICLENFSSTTHGSDGHPIQLLRCGHVFDKTCYEEWVSSGDGDVTKCPICRKDIGVTFDTTTPPRSLMDSQTQTRSFTTDAQSENDDIHNDDGIANSNVQSVVPHDDGSTTLFRESHGRFINGTIESCFGNNFHMAIVFQSDRNHRRRRLSELHPRHNTAAHDTSFRDRDPETTQNTHGYCSSAREHEHECHSVKDCQGGGGTSAGGKGGRF